MNDCGKNFSCYILHASAVSLNLHFFNSLFTTYLLGRIRLGLFQFENSDVFRLMTKYVL